MHYKTNRLNHDFQIIHFIAGSCHTPDGAYAILCDLKDDRADALKMLESSKLRAEAKRLRAQRMMASQDEAVQLEGRADLAELEAMAETDAKNVAAAQAELATIEKCMMALEPHRRYKHLPKPEAHEAAQAEEWKMELIRRAENCLLTTGTISTDQFATMRLHPEFTSAIMPAINEIKELMRSTDPVKLLEQMESRKLNLIRLLPGGGEKS